MVQATAAGIGALVLPITVAKIVVNLMPIIYTIIISYCSAALTQYFFIWIFDYYGYLEMDWLWNIIDPDRGDEIDGTDRWVQMNTSLVGIAIFTLAKAQGINAVDFDLTDSKNMTDLIILSYPLIYDNMIPSITLAQLVGFQQMIWYYIFPDAYADDKGLPRKGWAEILARTTQF